MKFYKISEDELKRLLESDKTLDALYAYGVDNWHGFEEVTEEECQVNDEDLEEYELLESEDE